MQNNVRVLRTMRKLKQEELADAVGISRQAVVAIEANRYDCSVRIAKQLAKYFGVKMDDMFFDDDEQMYFPNVLNPGMDKT